MARANRSSMGGSIYRFGDYRLDIGERRLTRGGDPLAPKPKTFDVLALLVERHGSLVTKDQFFDTVWAGVTVGDESLTQAIRQLRQLLDDDAAEPVFIETVPKQGYRFIAPVERENTHLHDEAAPEAPRRSLWPPVVAGTLGGGAAGLVGGLFFGGAAGMGNDAALTILVVMTAISIAIAALGAFGLSLAMALAGRIGGGGFAFSALGAALGGFVIGDFFHLLASGGFSTLFGAPHDDFTGGLEGFILGGAIAVGARAGGGMAGRWPRPIIGAGLAGGAAGALIALAGGNLLASSLTGLARRFHGEGLDFGLLGRLTEHGSLAEIAVAAGEGALLGAFMVGAILLRESRKSANDHRSVTARSGL